MPRRGDNIYKRKDGRWEGRISQKNGALGKRSYRSVYGKTYKEVKQKLEQEKTNIQINNKFFSMCEASRIWVEDRARYWKPTTSTIYMYIIKKYIIPYFGDVPINKIDAQAMESFVVTIMDEKENILSTNYLSYICATVLRIVAYINKKYSYKIVLPDNPINKSKKNPIIPPSEHTMSILEEYLIINSKKSINLGILTAFYTGIRIGELCALRWEDIDMDDEIMYIRRNVQRVQNTDDTSTKTKIIMQEPKTADSIRIVPIPPVLLPILRENQKEYSDYIINGTKQPWADPRTVQYQFKKILKKCGLEPFNFHMLRHYFASRCIAKGFDIKSLSEILGHSDIRLTLNLYVHSTTQHKKQLMNRFDTHLY